MKALRKRRNQGKLSKSWNFVDILEKWRYPGILTISWNFDEILENIAWNNTWMTISWKVVEILEYCRYPGKMSKSWNFDEILEFWRNPGCIGHFPAPSLLNSGWSPWPSAVVRKRTEPNWALPYVPCGLCLHRSLPTRVPCASLISTIGTTVGRGTMRRACAKHGYTADTDNMCLDSFGRTGANKGGVRNITNFVHCARNNQPLF